MTGNPLRVGNFVYPPLINFVSYKVFPILIGIDRYIRFRSGCSLEKLFALIEILTLDLMDTLPSSRPSYFYKDCMMNGITNLLLL